MRLIDADELKKALKSNCDTLCNDKNTGWCEHCCPLNDFEDLIDNAPTVVNEKLTTERPQGEWIFKHGSSDVWCSVCDISLESNLCEGIKFRFCPNCGAKMQKSE